MRLGTPLSAALNGWAEQQMGTSIFSPCPCLGPFPPPLRGLPRPSVSGHPGLAARATCRGRRRGRASESSDTTPWNVRMQRAASGGRGLRRDPAARSGRSPFKILGRGKLGHPCSSQIGTSMFFMSKALILFRRRCAACPGRLFPVTRASRPGLHAAAAGAAGPRNRAIRLHGSCGCNGPRPAAAAHGRIPPRVAAAVCSPDRQVRVSRETW